MNNFDNENCEKVREFSEVAMAKHDASQIEGTVGRLGITAYNKPAMSDSADNLSMKSLKGDREALVVRWGDGVEQRIAWRTLREHCPCATCRQKRSDPAPAPLFNILKPEEASPVRATAMTPIGNYAYQIDFSDGHKTGIFSLELLRDLGEEIGRG